MTITLSPKTEALLLEKAVREGKETNALANSILMEALDWEAWDREETIACIQRGLDDFAAGRYRSLPEFAAEMRAKYNLPNTIGNG